MPNNNILYVKLQVRGQTRGQNHPDGCCSSGAEVTFKPRRRNDVTFTHGNLSHLKIILFRLLTFPVRFVVTLAAGKCLSVC